MNKIEQAREALELGRHYILRSKNRWRDGDLAKLDEALDALSTPVDGAGADLDALAYRFWSVHPKELDEWAKTAPPMPDRYKGGIRAWFFACEMRATLTTPETEARLRERVADIVPDHCTGSAFVFSEGVLHVNKDGSGHIIVAEEHFSLEDDRGEGPDGPEGSVHWITHFPPGEMESLRDFLNGVPVAAESRLAQSNPAPAAGGQQEAVMWEYFSDPGFFDLWAVRPIGTSDFNETFHVHSKAEAEALVKALSRPAEQAVTEAHDKRYPSVFYSPDQSTRIKVAQYQGHENIEFSILLENRPGGAWAVCDLVPNDARQLALHILGKPSVAALQPQPVKGEDGE